MTKPVTQTTAPYAAQRCIYLGRIDMARGVIRHMENEIMQVQGMLDRLPLPVETPVACGCKSE